MDNPLLKDRTLDDPVKDAEDFARDLAYGAYFKDWDTKINVSDWGMWFNFHTGDPELTANAKRCQEKWELEKLQNPSFTLLASLGYLQLIAITDTNQYRYLLTAKAFDLLKKPADLKVFISYKHEESDALALALEARLIMGGAHVHIDKTLLGGQIWETELHRRLDDLKYVVCLLGPKALDLSGWVVKEIKWAVRAKKIIIPIAHLGTTMEHCKHIKGINPRQGHEVLKATALNYETAINFVLNAVELPQAYATQN